MRRLPTPSLRQDHRADEIIEHPCKDDQRHEDASHHAEFSTPILLKSLLKSAERKHEKQNHRDPREERKPARQIAEEPSPLTFRTPFTHRPTENPMPDFKPTEDIISMSEFRNTLANCAARTHKTHRPIFLTQDGSASTSRENLTSSPWRPAPST